MFVRGPLWGSLLVESAVLVASNKAASDRLGSSVAIDGDTIVVGAPGATIAGTAGAGAAYVFVRPTTGWSGVSTQRARLSASTRLVNDAFGYSVAISGNTIVAGAESGDIGGVVNSGAAYVFVRSPSLGWISTTETARLTVAAPAAGNRLGSSVAIDGDTIVVGAPFADPGGATDTGAAYVYVKPAGGWVNGTERGKLIGQGNSANGHMGMSVAVRGDTIVAGAPHAGDNSELNLGFAYVFVKPQSGWTNLGQVATLFASDGWGSLCLCVVDSHRFFGTSVAIEGKTIAVGAPGAISGTPFGFAGAVYTFDRPSTGWSGPISETGKFTASNTAPDYNPDVGYAVALSGETLVAGAPRSSVSGSPNAGAVYVSRWRTDKPVTFTASDKNPGSWAGYNVAVDGDTVVVGAPRSSPGGLTGAGSAYVFAAPSEGWGVTVQQSARLLPLYDLAENWFGVSVAIRGDTIVVGASHADDGGLLDSGAGYVFVKPAWGWNGLLYPSATLMASDRADWDRPGVSVAIDADRVVIGAAEADVNGVNGAGAAYVFVRPIGGWSGALTETAKLTANDGLQGDAFGRSVGISGGTAVIGAHTADPNGLYQAGVAYVFSEPPGGWLSGSSLSTPTPSPSGRSTPYKRA